MCCLRRNVQKALLTEFEREIFVGARSVGISISKTAVRAKYLITAIIKVYRERITKYKTRFQRYVSSRHRLRKDYPDRRIAKDVLSNITSYCGKNWSWSCERLCMNCSPHMTPNRLWIQMTIYKVTEHKDWVVDA